ncbi:MAG TPA: DNA repair protein RecO [Candidatus Jacksonbacteria bacterium]|nr:DNA repair protein RecO [Candidatus Jacksonbacteria bacterium]
MTFTTDAIVLDYTTYRDYDRIYSAYTRDYGKLNILARGANKIKSKLAGHMEPCCHSSLMVAEGRAFHILAQARSITSFAAIRLSADLLYTALSVLKAVDVLTRTESGDSRIFYLIGKTLARLQTSITHEEKKAVWYYYLLNLLIHLGHAPRVIDVKVLQPLIIADIAKDAILLTDEARALIDGYARPVFADTRMSFDAV